jgi:protein tyrosine phosphatase (PTP) superfamily phosphohydrolase (DUF442 family)
MESRTDATTADPNLARSRRRRRILRVALVATLAAASGFLGYFRRPLFEGNRGVVDQGLVIRSAQPTGDVARRIRDDGIVSILNLRGGGPADPWYAAEVEATQAAGVDFYDLPMSATRRPSRRELLTLLDLFGRCRYPLLIHCKSGSDRTGLAAGLYLMLRKGVPPTAAESTFSLGHGHVPLFGPERLHEPFREYAAWLAARGLDHTPERLLDWVRNEYRADDPLTAIKPAQPGPRVRHQATRPAEDTSRG